MILLSWQAIFISAVKIFTCIVKKRLYRIILNVRFCRHSCNNNNQLELNMGSKYFNGIAYLFKQLFYSINICTTRKVQIIGNTHLSRLVRNSNHKKGRVYTLE